MAFSWNPLPDKGNNVTSEKITEIRGKVDTLCDGISISRPTWAPLNKYEHIKTKLEEEVDRVDDNNYCRADKTTQFISENFGEDSAYYSGHDYPHYNALQWSLNTPEYGDYWGGRCSIRNIDNSPYHTFWETVEYLDHNSDTDLSL